MNATMAYTMPEMAQTDAANKARRDQGDAIRKRIMAELRRRQRAGEPSPTVTGLARMLDTQRQTAGYHVEVLVAAGLVEWYEPADGIRVLRLTSRA